jgi:hypothetical protein
MISNHKNNKQIVVIKADDCTGWLANWPTFISIIEKHKIKAGIGIIGKGIFESPEADLAYFKRILLGRHIEFWNHGWTHWSYPDHYELPDTYEFKGRPTSEQLFAIHETQKIIKKRLNVVCKTFGEPHNRFDENTLEALEKNDEIKVWLAFNNYFKSSKLVININSYIEEGWPGRVSYSQFVARYESEYKNLPYLLFQVHPTSPWDEDSWNDFEKIIEFFLSRQVLFMTPYEYYSYSLNMANKEYLIMVRKWLYRCYRALLRHIKPSK